MIALVGAWLSGFLSAFALGLIMKRETDDI
jgi:hypothetical protein